MKTDFKQIMDENFGKLTLPQLWALVKLSKNVRLRCRNNTAFNNFFNQTFGEVANFRTVTKTRNNRYTGQVESYPGLQIVMKDGTTMESEESED